jgi:tRNA(adenine34) deaminase
MALALGLAREAAAEGEVPVGCVIAGPDGSVIGSGRNRREKGSDATAHAEMEAIRSACAALGSWRLTDCSMYVTLEPCPMCAGAIINSRIERLVYGAPDLKAGSVSSVVRLFDLPYNWKPEVKSGVLAAECADLLGDFFRSLRKKP